MNYKQGDRVRIAVTVDPLSRHYAGKLGTVVGFMGELLVVDLDNGPDDFWVFPWNVSRCNNS